METDTCINLSGHGAMDNPFLQTNLPECLWNSSYNNITSCILFFIGLAIGYFLYKKKITISETSIKSAVVVVFCSGWIIYLIGFFSEGTKHSLIAWFIRPAMSSLEMFVSHSDLLEVDAFWKESPTYMTFFTVIHASAILLSGIVILYYLGSRFVSLFRLRQLRKRKDGIRNLYIFGDIDERSILLATDIHKNRSSDDAIVFIDSQTEEGHHGRLSFSHFFSTSSFPRELFDKINNLNAVLIQGKYPFDKKISEKKDTLKKLKLDTIIEKAQQTHFFFLSDNENANILSTLNLRNDQYLEKRNDTDKNPGKLQIFCHAYKDNINTIFQTESNHSAEIRIVDSSYLSVLSLKNLHEQADTVNKLCRQYLYHPVNFINIDTESGLAQTDFSSAIIGFGETGQEALHFLFEFGQFPYRKEKEKNPHFRCTVFDAHMDSIQGRYKMKTPAFENPELGVTFKHTDVNDIGFWPDIRKLLDELNYVVIAVGDDEKGITLAVDLYEFAQRYRKRGFDNFRIFVRSYKKANEERLNKVAEKYKEGITIFGASSAIFVKDLIINDSLLKMSQEFYYAYQIQEADPIGLAGLEKKTPEQIWNVRHGSDKSILDYQDILRKEGQDTSNAMHIYTKAKLIGGTSDPKRADILRNMLNIKEIVEMKDYFQRYPFLENLARCEHERWNAAHFALGYLRMRKEEQIGTSSCNKAQKTHLCLVDWEELPNVSTTDYQHYDRVVVQTTFSLKLKC